jgi:hypothetical protein
MKSTNQAKFVGKMHKPSYKRIIVFYLQQLCHEIFIHANVFAKMLV